MPWRSSPERAALSVCSCFLNKVVAAGCVAAKAARRPGLEREKAKASAEGAFAQPQTITHNRKTPALRGLPAGLPGLLRPIGTYWPALLAVARTPCRVPGSRCTQQPVQVALGLDRKSTRLNSSHLVISYAVFCLK